MRSLGIPAGFFYLAILYGLAGFLVFNARAFGLCWVDFLDASNRPMPRLFFFWNSSALPC